MDTGKLLKIIQDLQLDEQKLEVQTKLQNILTYYRNSQVEEEQSEISNLESALNESRVNSYVITDYRGLEELGIARFFGSNVFHEVNLILQGRTQEVPKIFEQFITDRQTILNRLTSVSTPLLELNLKPHTLQDSQFELGFTFPAPYTNLGELSVALKDIKLFLERLAAAVGDKEPLNITSVSNGHIEIFINAGIYLAKHFDAIVQRILEIKGIIELGKDFKSYTKNFLPEAKVKADEANEQNTNAKIDEIIERLPLDLKIKDPAEQEGLKKLFGKLISHFEKGLEAELRTPDLPEPVEPESEAAPNEQKKYREQLRLYNLKLKIDDKNKQLSLLQQNDFQQIKTQLLNSAKRTKVKSRPKKTKSSDRSNEE